MAHVPLIESAPWPRAPLDDRPRAGDRSSSLQVWCRTGSTASAFLVQFKQDSTTNAIGIRLAPLYGFNDLIKNEISVCAVLFGLDVHGLTCHPKRLVNSGVKLANFESRPRWIVAQLDEESQHLMGHVIGQPVALPKFRTNSASCGFLGVPCPEISQRLRHVRHPT